MAAQPLAKRQRIVETAKKQSPGTWHLTADVTFHILSLLSTTEQCSALGTCKLWAAIGRGRPRLWSALHFPAKPRVPYEHAFRLLVTAGNQLKSLRIDNLHIDTLDDGPGHMSKALLLSLAHLPAAQGLMRLDVAGVIKASSFKRVVIEAIKPQAFPQLTSLVLGLRDQYHRDGFWPSVQALLTMATRCKITHVDDFQLTDRKPCESCEFSLHTACVQPTCKLDICFECSVQRQIARGATISSRNCQDCGAFFCTHCPAGDMAVYCRGRCEWAICRACFAKPNNSARKCCVCDEAVSCAECAKCHRSFEACMDCGKAVHFECRRGQCKSIVIGSNLHWLHNVSNE